MKRNLVIASMALLGYGYIVFALVDHTPRFEADVIRCKKMCSEWDGREMQSYSKGECVCEIKEKK